MSTHTEADAVNLSVQWHALERQIGELRRQQAAIADQLGLRVITAHDPLAVRDFITEAVCLEYRVTLADLRRRDRCERLVWPRQMAMALLRTHTGQTLQVIGFFLERDHGTVLHAVEVLPDRLETNAVEQARYHRLTAALRARFP